MLKKELEEIKSSLKNHTVTKVEVKKEDTTSNIEVKNVEDVDNTDDDINEDNSDKTVPKDLIKDRWGFNYDQIKADKPFNGKQYSEFRDNLAKAHNIKKISYTDYINFLTIIGVKQIPEYNDNQKSTSRVAEYFNAFYKCLVSRGYNMFGITKMQDDITQTMTSNTESNRVMKKYNVKESSNVRDIIYRAYTNKTITYDDLINFCKIFSDEPVYLDRHNHSRNITEYNKIFDMISSRGYTMNGMTRLNDVTTQTNSNSKKYDKKEYLTAFNRILDEEMNHNYNDNDEDIYNQLLNNGNN